MGSSRSGPLSKDITLEISVELAMRLSSSKEDSINDTASGVLAGFFGLLSYFDFDVMTEYLEASFYNG